MAKQNVFKTVLLGSCTLASTVLFGVGGINEATQMITSYFETHLCHWCSRRIDRRRKSVQ